MANNLPLIELQGVSKNFGTTRVLHNIDLSINQNEFVCLLGPSGCGKTTTLRIIGGFESPSGGKILFDGVDVTSLPPYKRETNTVFQNYALFPHLNVYDNIAFGLRIKKVSYYPIGVLVTLVFMFLLNTVNGFLESAVVPSSQIDLNNIVQPVIVFDKILGLPSWIANIFSILVFIGVSVQLSAWASGPGKTIISSAQKGLYPPKFKFWKTDKFGDSHTVLLTQATIISLFALVYLLIPGINAAFLELVNATTVLYCVVYVFMAIGFIKLRLQKPDLKRPFKVGNTFVAWIVSIVLIATIIIALIATFAVGTLSNFIIVAIISIVLTLLPFWFVKIRKDSWTSEVKDLMAKENSASKH